MAHLAQQRFFESVKEKYPDHFHKVKVIDCGSLDVNGSLKHLFTDSVYVGVDIVPGKNVDVVSQIKDLPARTKYHTVVSGEMLEHDETWKESLEKMYQLAKKGGLIAISCAGKDRPEHGTIKSDGNEWGTGDYYMNIEPKHIKQVYKRDMFKDWYFEENTVAKDTYFYGIKK